MHRPAQKESKLKKEVKESVESIIICHPPTHSLQWAQEKEQFFNNYAFRIELENIFLYKAPKSKILGFINPMFSITTTELYHCLAKAVNNNK